MITERRNCCCKQRGHTEITAAADHMEGVLVLGNDFLMCCHGNTATQYPYTTMNSFQKQILPGFDNYSSAKCRHTRTKDNPDKSVVCYAWYVK